MTGRQVAYAVPVALSVLACAVALFLVWRRRAASRSVALYAVVLLGEVVWCLGYLLELCSPGLEAKLFWDKVQVLPAYVAALEGFRFALRYTGSRALTSARGHLALWALPLVHLALVYTSSLHGVVYADASVVPGEPFAVLLYSFTPIDYLGYLYALAVMAGTLGVLSAHLLRQRSAYRTALWPLIAGFALPMVAALFFFAGVTVLGQRDSMPYAFALSSLVITGSLLKGRLFDLLPIAHEAVIAAASQAMLVVDEAERVVEINPAMARLLEGGSDPVGEPLSKAVPWAAVALVDDSSDIELSSELVLEPHHARLHDGTGKPIGHLLTFYDATLTRRAARLLEHANQELEERVRERTSELVRVNASLRREVVERENAEREVAASRRQLYAVLDQAFSLISMLDPEGRLIQANRAALELIAKAPADVLEKPLWDTPWWSHSKELQEQLKLAVREAAQGKLVRFSATHPGADGELRYVDFSLKPVLDENERPTMLIAEGRDVTELRRADEAKHALEAQLAQAQKMDSLGRLAGGVAHDFNNLLTAILGNLELAKLDLPEDSVVRESLDQIQHASESAKGLVQQLLVFTRQRPAELSVVDLRVALEDVMRLVGRLLGADVRVELSLPERAARVKVDPLQLEQVILNLAVNARDAMPNGGKLVFAVSREVGADGARVVLAVSDTGVGMSEEVKARAFEPFFTTKPVGKGTGLGLALVFAMVRQNGGTVSVESAQGRGTRFELRFPEAEALEVEPEVPAPAEPPRGTETILLVEDQRELSRFAQQSLRRLGYTVHAFASAEELLAQRERVPPADLLLSDVVLPGLSGPALADRLASERPGLRVLFASGYHEDALRERTVSMAERRVLMKPFSIGELASAIRATLDGGAP
jgi:PAS domain S-box-containing protein